MTQRSIEMVGSIVEDLLFVLEELLRREKEEKEEENTTLAENPSMVGFNMFPRTCRIFLKREAEKRKMSKKNIGRCIVQSMQSIFDTKYSSLHVVLNRDVFYIKIRDLFTKTEPFVGEIRRLYTITTGVWDFLIEERRIGLWNAIFEHFTSATSFHDAPSSAYNLMAKVVRQHVSVIEHRKGRLVDFFLSRCRLEDCILASRLNISTKAQGMEWSSIGSLVEKVIDAENDSLCVGGLLFLKSLKASEEELHEGFRQPRAKRRRHIDPPTDVFEKIRTKIESGQRSDSHALRYRLMRMVLLAATKDERLSDSSDLSLIVFLKEVMENASIGTCIDSVLYFIHIMSKSLQGTQFVLPLMETIAKNGFSHSSWSFDSRKCERDELRVCDEYLVLDVVTRFWVVMKETIDISKARAVYAQIISSLSDEHVAEHVNTILQHNSVMDDESCISSLNKRLREFSITASSIFRDLHPIHEVQANPLTKDSEFIDTVFDMCAQEKSRGSDSLVQFARHIVLPMIQFTDVGSSFISDTNLQALVEAGVLWIQSRDARNRRVAMNLLPSLLERRPHIFVSSPSKQESPHEAFMMKLLSSVNSTRDSVNIAVILVLSRVASFGPEDFQTLALLFLLKRLTNPQESIRSVAQEEIKRLCTSFGHTPMEEMEARGPPIYRQILKAMINPKYSGLDREITTLFGLRSVKSLYELCVGKCFPEVHCEGDNLIKKIPKNILDHGDIWNVIDRETPRILCCMLLMEDENLFQERVKSFFSEWVVGKRVDFNSLVKCWINEIVNDLVKSFSTHAFGSVTRALEKVCNIMGSELVAQLLRGQFLGVAFCISKTFLASDKIKNVIDGLLCFQHTFELMGTYLDAFALKCISYLNGKCSVKNTLLVVQACATWKALVEALGHSSLLRYGSQILGEISQALLVNDETVEAISHVFEILSERCPRIFLDSDATILLKEKVPRLAPFCDKVLKELSATSPLVRIERLTRSIRSMNPTVREFAVRSVLDILHSSTHEIHKCVQDLSMRREKSVVTELIVSLLSALGQQGTKSLQSEIARCIGRLGAIDPSLLHFSHKQTVSALALPSQGKSLEKTLCIDIITHYLVRILGLCHDETTNRASFCIQELLRIHHEFSNMDDKETLSLFDEAVAGIVEPFYNSSFEIEVRSTDKPAIQVLYREGMSLSHWLPRTIRAMEVACPPSCFLSRVLDACYTIFAFDSDLAISVLPLAFLHVHLHGKEPQKNIMRRCIEEVSRTRERIPHVHAIFDALDVLERGYPDVAESLFDAQMLKLLSDAAMMQGSHVRSLRYLEMFLRVIHADSGPPSQLICDSRVVVGHLDDLYTVHSSLDEDEDYLLGVNALSYKVQSARNIRHEADLDMKLGKWSSALSRLDALLQDDPFDIGLHENCIECLRNLHHFRQMILHADGSKPFLHDDFEKSLMLEHAIEGAWKLGAWEDVRQRLAMLEESSSLVGGITYHRMETFFAKIVLAIAEGSDAENVNRLVSEARERVCMSLTAANRDSYESCYPFLVYLHALEDMSLSTQHQDVEWKAIVSSRLALTRKSLSVREPIMSTHRSVLLSQDQETATESLLDWSSLARSLGDLEVAFSSLLAAAQYSPIAAMMEEAKVMWLRGERSNAIEQLHRVLRMKEIERSKRLAADLKRTEWCLAEKSMTWADMNGFKERVLKEKHCLDKSFYLLGRFHDDAVSAVLSSSFDGPVSSRTDSSQFERIADAVYWYGMSAKEGYRHLQESLSRLLTLWFRFSRLCVSAFDLFRGKKVPKEFVQLSRISEKVASRMEDVVRDLPTSRWVQVLSILVSHVSTKDDRVRNMLTYVLGTCLREFPHEASWFVIPSSLYKNMERKNVVEEAVNTHVKPNFQVLEVVEQAKGIISCLNNVCILSKRFAKEKRKSGAANITDHRDIKDMLQLVPAVHAVVPVEKHLMPRLPYDMHDESYLAGFSPYIAEKRYVAKFDSRFHVMASKQRPIRIGLEDDLGQEYMFLCKYDDDLRKDAKVMELCGIMNRLLWKDAHARGRGLQARTFMVIPLSETTGVIEWMPHTMGLKGVLMSEYSHHGISIPKPRELMDWTERCKEGGKWNKEALYQLYQKLRERTPPIMHTFFFRNFVDPASWYQARLQFARSCALWSMIGNVVALGDRHIENILVDLKEGGLAHIDFDCLFNKGKSFPVKEMVPFRLTPNMVDGFGPLGVEGAFRVACERSLRVFQENKDKLLFAMEGFLEDPLLEWRRSGSHEFQNMKKAMDGMRRRLTGVIDGADAPISIERQVDSLIASARDPRNLSQMYCLWMPAM
eukprot:TRINITY_DN1162_c1_g1_i4.p1 TRINITY_DN1162_c1_g1~~TRINITY_DN1162_c1_g1_i4.p1  ORF type:complete len:2462 (+),score=563.59 TRINITY_DN1162_c1_g1_i4:483-7388(+)